VKTTAASGSFPYPHRTVAEVENFNRGAPVPADFKTFAPGRTINSLQKHYGVAERAIKRWRDQTGVRLYDPAIDPRPRKGCAIPDGFADIAARESDRALARLYDRDPKTIRRWRGLCGIERKKSAPKVKPQPAVQSIRGRFTAPAGMGVIPGPKAGVEEDAAQHLRRICAVYRCTETGRADLKGKFWRVGNAVLSPDELIARARAKAWDPDAWRRVA
jgi:hypothetical protein